MSSNLTINPRPPVNARRIMRWRDLPSSVSPAPFQVIDDNGDARTITVSKNKRRVLEGLMQAPMYCASPVRISDLVHVLKRDYGINIIMDLYQDDRPTDRAKFGVYTLVDKVKPINTNGGAQ